MNNVTGWLGQLQMQLLTPNMKVILFGAGANTEEIARELLRRGVKISGVMDNDSRKWGSKILDYSVQGIEYLKSIQINHHFIMITSMFFNEIEEQLDSLGLIKMDHYVSIYEMEYNQLFGLLGSYTRKEEQMWFDKIEEQRRQILNNDGWLQSVHMTVSQYCRKASSTYMKGKTLFRLLRMHRPSTCLELGTNFGISTAYQAAALELNGSGRVVTIEMNRELFPHSSALWYNSKADHRIRQIGGSFDVVLSDVISELGKVEYVYIDGNHKKDPTLRYFEQVYPSLVPGSIVVFDDIYWSDEMTEMWQIIKFDNRVEKTFEIYSFGICLIK